ncbi:MAG: hypothetical protein IJE66_02315 [Akkermansia sp.]|nr:hypothetical protein [Akkermansia sp.]
MDTMTPQHHARWELPHLLGADTMLVPICWGYAYNTWVGNVIIVPETFFTVAILTWMLALAGRTWYGLRTASAFYKKYAPALLLLQAVITALAIWLMCRQVGVHMLQLLRMPALLGTIGVIFGAMNRTMGRFSLSFALAISCLLPASYLNISANYLLGSDAEALFLLGLYFVSAPGADKAFPYRHTTRNHLIWLLILGIWSGYCGWVCSTAAARNLCYAIAGSTPIMVSLLLLGRYISPRAMQVWRYPALALPPLLAYLIL